MNKIKNGLCAIASILFEHITLFATIVASIYIITTSQYQEYKTEDLLLWIIGLLGLIATASVSEKYFKLSKIEKSICKIEKIIEKPKTGFDVLASTRQKLAPLEERLARANTITITGGSLYRLSDEYYAFFEKKLSSGCQIEIIMVKPNSNAANLLCDNVVYETKDYTEYSRKIEESLKRFLRLKKETNRNIQVRLTNKVPPFSLIVTDEKEANALIKVELYSYSVPTRERMQFEISKEDSSSFLFFLNQLEVIRNTSQEIDENYFDIEPATTASNSGELCN